MWLSPFPVGYGCYKFPFSVQLWNSCWFWKRSTTGFRILFLIMFFEVNSLLKSFSIFYLPPDGIIRMSDCLGLIRLWEYPLSLKELLLQLWLWKLHPQYIIREPKFDQFLRTQQIMHFLYWVAIFKLISVARDGYNCAKRSRCPRVTTEKRFF